MVDALFRVIGKVQAAEELPALQVAVLGQRTHKTLQTPEIGKIYCGRNSRKSQRI